VSSALGATSRIRLPGLFLVYAMTIPTLVLVLLVKDRWRSLRIVALALMVGAIAVSLNRNMYFGGVAGLLVTLLAGGGRLRYRFLISAVTIAAIVAVVVQSTVAPAVTAEIGTRAKSALSSQVLSTRSAQTRSDEFSNALTSIAHHPWTGVGWFQNYGSYELGVPRLGVEDWYLHLATDLGIPVALAFLLIPAVLLSYGLGRARRAAAPLDRALVAAGMGALVALLLSCLVGSYLQDPNSMTAFGFACGFLLSAALRATPKGEPSPSSAPDDQARERGATPCA
jgi:O-antigen ligase